MQPLKADIIGEDTHLPRYYQVYLTLRDWINNGNYRSNTQLPTEQELCETFGVSRITIRKAVDLLAADKMVRREQGRGTFVTQNGRIPTLTGDMGQLLKRVEDLGKRSKVRDINIMQEQVDEEAAADLHLDRIAEVLRISIVRENQGRPIGHSTTLIPVDLGVEVTADEVEAFTPISILEHKGINILSADQLISATLADMHDSAILGCAVGVPLVRIRLIVFDASYQPVERHDSRFLADYYQHHIHLIREPHEIGGFKWSQEP